MRKPIIAGNWKMNKDVSEAIELAKGIKEQIKDVKDVEAVLVPPFIDISEVLKITEGSNVSVGAQNCYWVNEGAYTGEIGPKMLKTLGCKYVVLGHSERRSIFKEDDDTINKKVKSALSEGLLPILCVGELLEQRESEQTFLVIEKQLKEGLKDVATEEMLKIVIAYEPVWAIGTGKTASPEQAQEVHKYIRDLLIELYNASVADSIRIQYGGSVKPDNVEGILSQPDVDGALVGGASLKAYSFAELVKKSSKAV
jgi:triosephosphate isomerase